MHTEHTWSLDWGAPVDGLFCEEGGWQVEGEGELGGLGWLEVEPV